MNRSPFLSACLVTSAVLQGCLLAPIPLTAEQAQRQQAAAMAQSYEAVDAQYVQTLAQYRSRALATPGSPPEAKMWAGVLEAAYEAGSVSRGKVDGPTQVRELSTALDAAVAQHPEEKGELLAMKGRVQLRAGMKAEGVSTLRASLGAKPSTTALLPLIAELDEQGARVEIIPLCKKMRPAITTNDERYLLLDRCLRHSGASSVEQGLAWAGPADIAFYEDQQQQAAARDAARAQAREDSARQMMADSQARQREDAARMAESSRSSPSGGGFVPTTITVVSECPRTVRVFYGEKPKYGSGRESTVSGHSRSSEPRDADGSFMMWIIDDSGNGISSTQAGPGQREVIINSSCTGFTSR